MKMVERKNTRVSSSHLAPAQHTPPGCAKDALGVDGRPRPLTSSMCTAPGGAKEDNSIRIRGDRCREADSWSSSVPLRHCLLARPKVGGAGCREANSSLAVQPSGQALAHWQRGLGQIKRSVQLCSSDGIQGQWAEQGSAKELLSLN